MAATISSSKAPPSARWTSFDGWDYNGMTERLESLLANLDKSALIRHAELIMGQKLTMSKPFLAGQYWVCFEMVADDGSLVIARVRLPRHPGTPATISKEDELYSITCEVATMNFVRQKVPSVRVPNVYAYEVPGSPVAAEVGAVYMLLEGFHGNTLQDIQFDMCQLPVSDSLLTSLLFVSLFLIWYPYQLLAAGSRPQLRNTSSHSGPRHKQNWLPWLILTLARSPPYPKPGNLSLASCPLQYPKAVEAAGRSRVRRNTSWPLQRRQ